MSPAGVVSSARMPAAKRPPSMNASVTKTRYSRPMRLWSFVSNHDLMPNSWLRYVLRGSAVVVILLPLSGTRRGRLRGLRRRGRCGQRLDVLDERHHALFVPEAL